MIHYGTELTTACIYTFIISCSVWPLSIICCSFREIDKYTTGFPCGDGHGHADIFRAVKHCLPGPYTFILTAKKELPKQCIRYGTTTSKYASRKNVGVRIPDDAVCQAMLEKMDAPWTSVRSSKEDEWILDPVVIADVYGPGGLDFVVDGGVRVADPSTVVDMTVVPSRIIRQGKKMRVILSAKRKPHLLRILGANHGIQVHVGNPSLPFVILVNSLATC